MNNHNILHHMFKMATHAVFVSLEFINIGLKIRMKLYPSFAEYLLERTTKVYQHKMLNNYFLFFYWLAGRIRDARYD